jgi:hypothetical protein
MRAVGVRWLRETLSARSVSTEVGPDVLQKALVGAATLATEQAAYEEAEVLCA